MILVTGGTGFVGSALIPQLIHSGKQVRTLLRPSPVSPRLPRGVPVEVAVSSLLDERSLRAAMKGVDTVIHLAGVERQSASGNLHEVDVEGSISVGAAAAHAGVRRIIYLSHVGADKHSAYPVLQAKGLAENALIQSGVPYTIFRSTVLFGPGDQFTTGIVRLLRRSPLFFLMPGDGSSLVQPLWIEDLVTAIHLSLDDPEAENKLFTIGGSEALTYRYVVELVMQATRVQRKLVAMPPAYLRKIAPYVEQPKKQFPISLYWLDYLAADRTCPPDALPRQFGLIPARFHQQLGYLSPT